MKCFSQTLFRLPLQVKVKVYIDQFIYLFISIVPMHKWWPYSYTDRQFSPLSSPLLSLSLSLSLSLTHTHTHARTHSRPFSGISKTPTASPGLRPPQNRVLCIMLDCFLWFDPQGSHFFAAITPRSTLTWSTTC